MTLTPFLLTPRVKQILQFYRSDNPGTLVNLARFLSAGKLGGSGRMLFLAVDQGFEHGPIQSYMKNQPAMDPEYHFDLAVENQLSGYAAPLGQLEVIADKYYGQIPLILKINNSHKLLDQKQTAPDLSVTASVDDALRLGCSGIGFTLYPGSAASSDQMEELREISAEAKAKGLVVVVWSYPRGGVISSEGQTAIDVVSYGAHLACLMGAHIIKVKVPTSKVETEAAHQEYYQANFNFNDLSQRIKQVVQSSFVGKRIVIFSGGEIKKDEELLNEITAIHQGGGFGSIIGRNCFQRARGDAEGVIKKIMTIYTS